MSTNGTRGIRLSKFLVPELTKDGDDSGTTFINPSKLSLIFITTLVNNYNMQVLIDTGATTTFINNHTLESIKPYPCLKPQISSFVLADGIAPFPVLGIVELQILFSNQLTSISAHVASNLCTDVILGMDYITLYNLKFNIRQQIVSIELNNRQYDMNISQNVQTELIPVTLSDPLRIPPKTNRSAKVSIPVPSICSQFIPDYQFSLCNTACISHKFLQFCNHSSHVTFANSSCRPHCIPQGIRIGYLCRYSPSPSNSKNSIHFDRSCGVTNQIGSSPDSHASNKTDRSCGVTNQIGSSPDSHDSHKIIRDGHHIQYPPSCSHVQRIHPSTEQHIHQLIDRISIKQHRDDLLTLLLRFNKLFDITKHNIANTPIHHVINTVPHSPPSSKPYPQPDKEEIMFRMIQEFIHAGLVSESHSPYAGSGFLGP